MCAQSQKLKRIWKYTGQIKENKIIEIHVNMWIFLKRSVSVVDIISKKIAQSFPFHNCSIATNSPSFRKNERINSGDFTLRVILCTQTNVELLEMTNAVMIFR